MDATSRTTPTTRSTATSASGRPTARSRRGCASCRRTRSCGRSAASAARRCTTTATARARCPASSAATTGRDRDAYDRAHEFPFTYRELRALLRVGRAHAAGADRGDGHEGGGLPARRAARWACRSSARKDITRDAHRPQENAILQPQRHRRADERPGEARATRRRRAARSAASASRAATSRAARRATSPPSARPTTRTCRWR